MRRSPPRPHRRRLRTALVVAVVAAGVASGADGAAGQDPGESTTTSSSTTSTTTSTSTTTTTTVATTTTQPGPTTTTTAPPDDPVGASDAAPEEPPGDVFVPGTPVGQTLSVLRSELSGVQADLDLTRNEIALAAADVDALSERLAVLQGELAKLDVAQQISVEQIDAAEERFRERVADALIRGNAAELDSVIAAADGLDLAKRAVLLRRITEADQQSIDRYRDARDVADAGLLELRDDVVRTRRALREAREHFESVLSLNAERRFQVAVLAAGSEIVIDGFVFPVGEPYNFGDSFGAPRMIGTSYAHGHQGTDIMAPFGTPLYAVERGVLARVGTDVLGGNKLWVKGQSGTSYYYAHLQSYAPGMQTGTVVQAGQVVGFVGDSGNARGGAPHLHFEVHPGGGKAVNPYQLLRAASDLTRQGQ